MKIKRYIFLLITLCVLSVAVFFALKKININPKYHIGQIIDSINGVYVYYNGGIDNTCGRNIAADNYNLGLKYQCVEFVKRYYYQHLNHKMPDTYGNAKDFFDEKTKDGQINKKRNLIQYKNPSSTKPMADDILIFDGTVSNKYGHIAIISKVTDKEIEIVQQNPGQFD
ncbi:MAG: CHAP domain-containing protein, partial [Prevotellaceae bacterium]|nr:CHAP domain-containing protein [Prevotellaceae bacterium]